MCVGGGGDLIPQSVVTWDAVALCTAAMGIGSAKSLERVDAQPLMAPRCCGVPQAKKAGTLLPSAVTAAAMQSGMAEAEGSDDEVYAAAAAALERGADGVGTSGPDASSGRWPSQRAVLPRKLHVHSVLDSISKGGVSDTLVLVTCKHAAPSLG